MPSATRLQVKLSLPDEVVELYEKQATERGKTLEQLLAERLTKCVGHTAQRPLYFDDDAREAFETMCGGKIINDPLRAVENLNRSLTVTVGEVKVTLDQKLLERLQSRVFRGETIESVIEREVLLGLQRFTGLMP